MAWECDTEHAARCRSGKHSIQGKLQLVQAPQISAAGVFPSDPNNVWLGDRAVGAWLELYVIIL